MTKEEYINLLKEWKNNDSIKRRDEIENIVFEEAKRLLIKLNHLYEKYGRKFVDDSDYIEDKGYLSIHLDYSNFENIKLIYTDSWAYDGLCEIGIDIPAEYFDKDKFDILENKLKQDRISFLEEDIDKMESKIKYLEDGIKINRNELEHLKEKIHSMQDEKFSEEK